ncbi:hypothetical protein [Hugenholtzia roseola]|uniref:hypothetical protein n=1 Tax=Hugenholtzia roseola TaxID=1002 RepID=UPI00054F3EBE|nr:hypothetical protein [Hugenholtzia roseola]
MKKTVGSLFFFFAILCTTNLWAQGTIMIGENAPAQVEGIELGYNITNARRQDVGREEMERYEITLYMTNRSGCSKIVLLNDNVVNTSMSGNAPDVFAVFDCTNATGKRLTSRSANLRAPQFFIPIRRTEKNAEGKDVTRTENVHAGFALRNGETINTTIIVIVPLGERPRMQARLTMFSNF